MLFLGIVRSLAASGVPYSCVTYDWPGSGPWWSEHSRFFDNEIPISNPAEYAQRAVAELVDSLAPWTGEPPILLPSSDTSLMFLLDNERDFAPVLRVIGDPDFGSFRGDVIDKGRCAQLLEEAGVPAPITASVDRLRDIDAAVKKVPLPAVVKPAVKDYAQSFYRMHGGLKAVSCETAEELRLVLEACVTAGHRLVAQERIPFASASEEIPAYLYVDAHQKPWAYVGAVKERIDPPPFGTATVLRLVDHPDLFECSLRVAEALGWRGMLMVEFIQDERDGEWKVIEVNGRPWLMIDFFRRAGVDFIGALVRDASGGSAPSEVVRLNEGVDPLHIDVETVGDAWASAGRTPTIDSIGTFLDRQHGDISHPFLAPFDRDPGLRRLEDAARRWGLDAGLLVECVESRLGDQ